nr:MAG TPA: hypothetical protein [Bacteriophage sp.]
MIHFSNDLLKLLLLLIQDVLLLQNNAILYIQFY